MHKRLHGMLRRYKNNLDELYDKKKGMEFETYIAYWLSALFVVVEGFNKMKLKDKDVRRLFTKHLRVLKSVRHDTYHFTIERETLPELNWAEDLHHAVGEYIKENIIKEIMEEQSGNDKPSLSQH